MFDIGTSNKTKMTYVYILCKCMIELLCASVYIWCMDIGYKLTKRVTPIVEFKNLLMDSNFNISESYMQVYFTLRTYPDIL